jgi:hypothetical protein
MSRGSSVSIVSDYGLHDWVNGVWFPAEANNLSSSPCIKTGSSLMMEAVRTSETLVDNYFTRQYIPEDNSEHHTRRRENFKCHTSFALLSRRIAWTDSTKSSSDGTKPPLAIRRSGKDVLTVWTVQLVLQPRSAGTAGLLRPVRSDTKVYTLHLWLKVYVTRYCCWDIHTR